MAILSYNNLFARLKVLIKYFNVLEARQVSTVSTNLPLPYIKNEILSPFESQDKTAELRTLEEDFLNAIIGGGTLKLSIITWFEAVLTSIAPTLGVATTDALIILNSLADAMTHDSETLNRRELAVDPSDLASDGTIVPHSSNVGTGRLVYTFTRPGLTPCEIANTEVLQCYCSAATNVQQESFQLSGEQTFSRDSYEGQGSGLGPVMTVLGKSIVNGDFETWSGSPAVPTGWTAVTGDWGTEILQEASTVYQGSYSVKTAYAQGDWKITTPVPITLVPNTMYAIGFWIRKGTGATGSIYIGLSNGNTKTAFVSGCYLTVDLSALTTNFAFRFLAFKAPAAVNSTWTIGIASDSQAVADVYFDYIQFGAMTKFNQMHFAVFAGATNFGIGDKFGFGSDNTGFKINETAAGVIQKFIGRMFGTQLPSATGGAETIADP